MLHSRLLLLPVFLVLPVLTGAPLPARAAGGAVTVSTVAHGVKLTLVVPSRAYPRNALVRFTVRVRNVSSHTVFTRIGPQCSDYNPSVEVLDEKSTPTSPYPPGFFPHPCPLPLIPMQPFRPGARATERVIAIVNGPFLRATLLLGRRTWTRVVTPAVSVALLDAAPPRLVLHGSPQGPFVTVERPTGARGRLFALDSSVCGLPGGVQLVNSNMLWYPVKGDRVYSGCLGPQEWHGFAGYLNYPVASIEYTDRG